MGCFIVGIFRFGRNQLRSAVIGKTELTVNTFRVHEQIIDKGSDQRKIYDRLLSFTLLIRHGIHGMEGNRINKNHFVNDGGDPVDLP